ncbi:hypothetical protein [Streptomyces chryseus]
MNMMVRRICAVAVLLAGVSLGLWIVYGDPFGWRGGLRLLRFGLGLASMGLITASAWLMFPGGREDDEDPAAASTARDPAPPPGPLDV